MSVIPPVLHSSARAIGVREFLDALQAIAPRRFPSARGRIQRRVGLAISGGVDSMALAFLCSRLLRVDPFLDVADNPLSKFQAFVVDHKLREGSAEEARKVRAVLTNRLDINTEILVANWAEVVGQAAAQHPADLPNIETLARRVRYRRLGRGCAKSHIVSLLVAHHEDDQYETVLMRLLAGHGYRGLLGMRPAADIPECGDMHGVYRSGLVDDQLDMNPFCSMKPSKRERRDLRMELRWEMDPSLLAQEIKEGLRPDENSPYIDEESHSSKWAPPLAPMFVEDGGVTMYRPLLQFSKERLVATCVENKIPWFEDHTNADPTLTTRNALRQISRNHTLPVALQKPAILRLAERCRSRLAREEAEADRLMTRLVLTDFEPGAGTALIQLPTFCLPRAPRRCVSSRAHQERRLDHYRVIAALLIRRVLTLVTPEESLPTIPNLDSIVSRLFPSLVHGKHPPAPPQPKAFSIAGVHFIPLMGPTHPLRWYISRAPYPSTVARPVVHFPRLFLRQRVRKPARRWPMGDWSEWRLFDGRYWVRVRHRLPFRLIIAPFAAEHAKSFREKLPEDKRSLLAALLRRHAPAKVRFTLPALYAESDVSHLLRGEDYWPSDSALFAEFGAGLEQVESREEQGDAALKFDPTSIARYLGADEATITGPTASKVSVHRQVARWKFDGAMAEKTDAQLLALPTMNVQIPELEHWVEWDIRYRRIDLELLRLSAPHPFYLRETKRRNQLARRGGGRIASPRRQLASMPLSARPRRSTRRVIKRKEGCL
jgi:tRNA(Ile)-lysidine synthase